MNSLHSHIAVWCLIAFFSGCGKSTAPETAAPVPVQGPIPVKVVVVTMFEIGADSGDAPGEFQLWYERQKLTQKFPFPQSHHDLFFNPDTGVLGLVTGMGTNKSSSAVMALGLDPRFDLTRAYWLVAGISGFDPMDASIGSAAWAEWVIDGDLGHEIDARELPEGWETGFFPLFSNGPYADQRPPNQGEAFQLNGRLTEWALQLTQNIQLPDDPRIAGLREQIRDFPQAQTLPRVLKGDNIASMTFWHGQYFNDWANRWVAYWSDNRGNFVSSAMEDTGTAQSLFYLDRAGKADYDRLLVLRTASNFTMPVNGISAAENLLAEGEDYAGLTLALESAYEVGSAVVEELVRGWEKYADKPPYEK